MKKESLTKKGKELFPLIGNLIEYEGINIMEAKEIAATKAYTIGRRGFYKDYIDLVF